eukprot:m.622 g.622  ORF g.622 m.622 type:complete len:164 (+) comp226_c0_seq2:106-597(+)
MKKASRAPPPPRLPNNGEIEVWYGGDDPAHPTTMTHHTLQTIHYRLDEDTGVATCTLNDPARLNPLSTCQIWEYNLVLKHAARDERVRVLLWTGHGRAFSAGADLRGQAEPLSLDSAAVACKLLNCPVATSALLLVKAVMDDCRSLRSKYESGCLNRVHRAGV